MNEMKDVANENIEISGPVKIEREKLEIMAKTIGIDSKKKTDDELRTEITIKNGQREIDKQSKYNYILYFLNLFINDKYLLQVVYL